MSLNAGQMYCPGYTTRGARCASAAASAIIRRSPLAALYAAAASRAEDHDDPGVAGPPRARHAEPRARESRARAAFASLGIAVAVAVFAASIGGGMARCGARLGMTALLFLVVRYRTVPLTVVYLVVGTGIVFALTTLVMNSQPASRPRTTPRSRCRASRCCSSAGPAADRSSRSSGRALGYALGEARRCSARCSSAASSCPATRRPRRSSSCVVVRTFDGLSRRYDARHADRPSRREPAVARARHPPRVRAAGDGTACTTPPSATWSRSPRQVRGGSTSGCAPASAKTSDSSSVATGPSSSRSTPAGHPRSARTRTRDESRPAGSNRLARDTVPAAAPCARGRHERGTRGAYHGRPRGARARSTPPAAAVDEAVAQCLVNVARHAGVAEAETRAGHRRRRGDRRGHGQRESASTCTRFRPTASACARRFARASSRWRAACACGRRKGIGTTIVITVPEGDA